MSGSDMTREAPIYDIYEIHPKRPTAAFVSQIAPISERDGKLHVLAELRGSPIRPQSSYARSRKPAIHSGWTLGAQRRHDLRWRSDMAFVNEFIPAEDVEKYGLKEIDKHFIVGGTNSRQWTIDRERDIYLRNVARGREDWRNETKWTLYWRGDELTLRLDLLDGKGGRGEPGWSHWRLIRLNGSYGLPEHLKAHKEEVLETLKEALLAYKDFGVYSSNTDYSVTLDIAEECVL